MIKAFLAIPATLVTSERMWSCSGKILFAKTAKLKASVKLATIFVTDNAEVLREYYEKIVEMVNNPILLYLSEAGK